MYCETQIKSNRREKISEDKKLSLFDSCESKFSQSLKHKQQMRKEKAMLDKLVDEMAEIGHFSEVSR